MKTLSPLAALFLLLPSLPASTVYLYDDGTAEFSTIASANQIIMNNFQVSAPNTTISGMMFYNFWDPNIGKAINYNLWSDPDADGHPSDAQLLQTVSTTVTNAGWQTVMFPALTAFNDGDRFFVGISFYDPQAAYFLGGNDTNTLANGLSYFISFAGPGPGDFSHPNTGSVSTYGVTLGYTGVLMVRALGEDPSAGVPEPSSVLLTALGAAAVAALRRRR